MFRVEKMMSKDFPFAVDLANTMDWNMAESDFAFMAKLEPDGCFVLLEGRERVGMATCIGYEDVGWFGNLAVKPEYRRRGAGTYLVKYAVQYLKDRGVETVGLYAYQRLISFYERIGFKPYDDFAILNGKATKISREQGTLKASEEDIPILTEFDRKCSGWDRKSLFESIFREEKNLSYFSALNGEVTGFVMAKVYDVLAEVGPLVCRQDSFDVATALLKTVLNKLRGKEASIYLPVDEKGLLEFLIKLGFREQFRVKRMFSGPLAGGNCIYAAESLERG
jgi:GNAT superfamily N-acetyltransferase